MGGDQNRGFQARERSLLPCWEKYDFHSGNACSCPSGVLIETRDVLIPIPVLKKPPILPKMLLSVSASTQVYRSDTK